MTNQSSPVNGSPYTNELHSIHQNKKAQNKQTPVEKIDVPNIMNPIKIPNKNAPLNFSGDLEVSDKLANTVEDIEKQAQIILGKNNSASYNSLTKNDSLFQEILDEDEPLPDLDDDSILLELPDLDTELEVFFPISETSSTSTNEFIELPTITVSTEMESIKNIENLINNVSNIHSLKNTIENVVAQSLAYFQVSEDLLVVKKSHHNSLLQQIHSNPNHFELSKSVKILVIDDEIWGKFIESISKKIGDEISKRSLQNEKAEGKESAERSDSESKYRRNINPDAKAKTTELKKNKKRASTFDKDQRAAEIIYENERNLIKNKILKDEISHEKKERAIKKEIVRSRIRNEGIKKEIEKNN